MASPSITVPTPSDMRSAPLLPGPRYTLPFRFFKNVRAGPREYYRGLVKEYGDVGCVKMYPRCQIWTARPEHYRYFLIEKADLYPKGIAFERLKKIGGNGIFLSDGERWKKNRKLIQGPLRHNAMIRLIPHVTRGASDFVDRMEARVGKPSFDIVPNMAEVAMDIACRAFFGDDILDRAQTLSNALWETSEWIDNAMNSLFPAPFWVPTRINRKTRRSLDVMFGGLDELIRDARKRGQRDNMLAVLLAAVDAGELTEAELRDEMWTLLNAGHETTATTLGFAFSFLSQHPEARERVEREVDALGGRPPGWDDFERLGFTYRVVQETLRLLPPAWSTSREAIRDDLVDGHRIPKGSLIQPLIYLTHLHPEFWDEPDRFDPDRFLPDRSVDRPVEAYIPFGLGGRRCIGERFAMAEATIVLASFVQRLEFHLEPGFEVVDGIMGFGPVRAMNGIRMTVHRRPGA